MKRKGFTLVELLVVISIIALLMAILMPVLSKVKAIANQMMCGTNLAGIGKGMMLYAGDNDDDYPIAGGRRPEWVATGALAGGNGWCEELAEDAYGKAPPGAQVTITSSLYLLVKYTDMTPAQFVCNGDILIDEFKLSDYTLPRADMELADLWDFGPNPGLCCSYSYQLPYSTRMSLDEQAFPVSPQSSPSAAVAADRNPYLDESAKDYRPDKLEKGTLTAPDWVGSARSGHYVDPDKTGNSASHQRNGQNVLFNDIHVKFEKYPNVGVNDDNIWLYWKQNAEDPEDFQVDGRRPEIAGGGAPQSDKDALLVNERNIAPKKK